MDWLGISEGFPGGSVIKNLPANAGDTGDAGLLPGSGRSPGGRHGNPLQYSCLENPMDRGAWRATVHGVPRVEHNRAAKRSAARTWVGLPCGSDSKESARNAGDLGSIPGLGRSPGKGNGNLLQYSCLENPMDRGARWATVHWVTKSQTWLSD